MTMNDFLLLLTIALLTGLTYLTAYKRGKKSGIELGLKIMISVMDKGVDLVIKDIASKAAPGQDAKINLEFSKHGMFAKTEIVPGEKK